MQITLVAPKNPSKPSVNEPKLMAGGVDRNHTRNVETPFQVGIGKRCDESSGCAINVNRNIESFVFLELINCDGEVYA